MEVFKSEDYYVFAKDASSLWWNRTTGKFSCRSAWDLSDLDDIECLGVTPAIIGKIEHEAVLEPRLMIVKECSAVGNFYDDHIIYKIRSICLLSAVDDDAEANLVPCKKHHPGRLPAPAPPPPEPPAKGGGLFDGASPFNRTWGAVKSAGSTIKTTTKQAAAVAASQVKQTVRKRRTDSKERDRLEKRIGEELHKIFDDTDSFYFCKTADITNSLQRLENKNPSAPGGLWKGADDRFFWNKHMLKDIIEMGSPDCEPWIIPIIQGHVQVRQCEVDVGECSRQLNTESLRGSASRHRETFTLSLISRRSRFRAGTRYKRRGIDENGHVANYVETEQSLAHHAHRVSFVQVRGSAPLYWSQPGLKYRPPPRLDKGEQESQMAFNKHFDCERVLYGPPVCIVNLVEQVGREKIIFDAFSNHVFAYNQPDVIYTTFDFHEYCRGMHFENVSILINALTDIIADMGYCWRDPQGYICRQTGVFRVNCIDCLDRTNVVQTAVAKAVLEMQVTRLGLSGPDWPLPISLRSTLHELWADNGDVISRQYAGTNALKGDYTRTGERKFTGLMKDGMNSANRYYIQHFSDAFRQCCLDLMLGNPIHDSDIDYEMEVFSKLKMLGGIADSIISPAVIELPHSSSVPAYFNRGIRNELMMLDLTYGLSSYYLSRFKDAFRQATIDLMLGEAEVSEMMLQNDGGESEEERQATADHVKQLIEDCKKLLVSEPQNVLGAWGLIDADPGTGDPHETEMDSILILTRDGYLVADYDDHTDRVTKFQHTPLTDVTLLEFGTLETSSNMSLTSLKSNLSLGGSKKPVENAPCIRIHYRIDGQDGYFHMFRSTNLRFFNNMAVYIKTPEEIYESLRSVCECFMVAIVAASLPEILFKHDVKLDKRKSKVRPNTHLEGGAGRKTLYLAALPTNITRNLSETQLAIKSVGSKALTNMSEQFSKLNKFGHQTFKTKPELPKPFKLDGSVGSSKPKFTLGSLKDPKAQTKKKKGENSDCSSDNSSDDEDDIEGAKVNIFEPTLDNFEFCQKYVGDNPLLKSTTAASDVKAVDAADECASEAYLIENPLYSSKIDAQTCGDDVFSSEYLVEIEPTPTTSMSVSNSRHFNQSFNKLNPFNDTNDRNIEETRSTTPEITINYDNSFNEWEKNDRSKQPPTSLKLNQKLSHSSGEVDLNQTNASALDLQTESEQVEIADQLPRSNSQQDVMSASITQSRSESALKQLINITSPVSGPAKDLVLSPFSKFAKGVQSLGANLDPRKIKGAHNVKQITEQQYEEHRKLQEKWKDCNTKLIAL